MAAIVCSAAKMFNGDDVKILPIVGTTRLIIHLYAIHRVLHLATPLGHSFMSPLATIPWAQSAVGGRTPAPNSSSRVRIIATSQPNKTTATPTDTAVTLQNHSHTPRATPNRGSPSHDNLNTKMTTEPPRTQHRPRKNEHFSSKRTF